METRPPHTWETYVQAFGRELCRRRHEAGLSQRSIAQLAGLTRYHYQQLEKGESRPGTPANPSLRLVISLAQALGVELADLLPPEPPPTPGLR